MEKIIYAGPYERLLDRNRFGLFLSIIVPGTEYESGGNDSTNVYFNYVTPSRTLIKHRSPIMPKRVKNELTISLSGEDETDIGEVERRVLKGIGLLRRVRGKQGIMTPEIKKSLDKIRKR